MISSDVSERSRLISGKGLYLLLLISLSVVAIGADIQSGRFASPMVTLTIPLEVSALVVTILGYWVVPLLRALKAGQVIREDGPQTHLKKAGTPTMGGIFFVPVALLLSLGWVATTQPQQLEAVMAAVTLTFVLGLVGWLDDWQVLRRKSNRGISARLRLAVELGSGALFGLWLILRQPEIMTLQLPFKIELTLGMAFLALSTFVVAAESNAVNLTDGMDGLAAGTCAIALCGMALVVAPTWPGLMIFAACMSGGCLGFLAHNYNPARVFMGDTGSLALGGALAAVGLISNTLWALLILSGLFLVESLSVIAQVAYFKATKGPDGVGKRLLRMSPIHNHFELSGWSEIRVVSTFYGVVAILAVVGLGLNQLQ